MELKEPKEYQEIIRPFLTEKRYTHSLCVSEAAVTLAKKYGGDLRKAETAGILHDIMKDLPQDEQLKMMEQFGIILTNVERSAPKLWHAMLGAAYIKNELHLDDAEILDAVRYHTTGRENMTLLDKIIFIADFISADRDYEGVDNLRKAAEISLEAAMIAGITFTIQDLASGHKPIHPDTVSAYNQTVLALKS
jgi:predicted HD superfamily hydrolase involved in NAD metabolism